MPNVRTTTDAVFESSPGISLLDAAAHAGILLPYSCKTGRCSTCKCRVISGRTSTLLPETGLSDEEKADSWILACARAAESDLLIEAQELGNVTLPPARTLPCKINAIQRMAPDVVRILLRLPPASDFAFLPGQYIDIIGNAGVRRSYSLANASAAGGTLELHIRAIKAGAMTDYWFRQAKNNDLLRLHGPLGTFFLESCAGMDLIFLATGTGIAPIKAILESLPREPEQQPGSVTVLWGGRTPTDLYLDIAAMPGTHRYIPVLSRADGTWSGTRGHVQDVLLALLPDLDNTAVYACGSDAMIHGARETLLRAGLPEQRFHSDAFVCSAHPSIAQSR